MKTFACLYNRDHLLLVKIVQTVCISYEYLKKAYLIMAVHPVTIKRTNQIVLNNTANISKLSLHRTCSVFD